MKILLDLFDLQYFLFKHKTLYGKLGLGVSFLHIVIKYVIEHSNKSTNNNIQFQYGRFHLSFLNTYAVYTLSFRKPYLSHIYVNKQYHKYLGCTENTQMRECSTKCVHAKSLWRRGGIRLPREVILETSIPLNEILVDKSRRRNTTYICQSFVGYAKTDLIYQEIFISHSILRSMNHILTRLILGR